MCDSKTSDKVKKTLINLYETYSEVLSKWLSCNGEVWGVGPTVVFASAAALFLYNELEATVFAQSGDQANVTSLERTLITTMMLGMLALMVHLWVCSMRFFQYYLDTVIRDSPSMLLEMTTVGLLGGQPELVPLGPLTRFMKQQQPQIHITICWFLSLCYADYVRKHYCHRFNLPYLEQWQTELQERIVRLSRETMERVNYFIAVIQQRLRGYGPTVDEHNRRECNNSPNTEICPTCGGSKDQGGNTAPSERVPIRIVGVSSDITVDTSGNLKHCFQKEVAKETEIPRTVAEPITMCVSVEHKGSRTSDPAAQAEGVGTPRTAHTDKAVA